MKTLVFAPGAVRSLSTYLEYFFLRFPGSLGPEESWDLECLDTYDRVWTRKGQVWVRRNEVLSVVSPPSLFPENDAPAGFGLQAPQLLGKVTAKVRTVTFESAQHSPILGQLVKVRGRSFLILQGKEDARWEVLVGAVRVDGLQSLSPGSFPLVTDRGPGFVGPHLWPTPLDSEAAIGFLVDRLADGMRVARQYEKGIRDDVDTECLHQYRVHLRRVRSLTSLGLMWQTTPEWNRLKTVLRTLQQKTNELRDLDVLLLDFPGLQSQLPWDEGERLAGWEETLKNRRKAEWRRVKTWLASEEHRLASQEIDRLLADLRGLGEPWTCRDLASSAFDRSARGLRRSLKGLEPTSPDEAVHEVRIRTKRLRYVLDGLGSLGPPPVIKILSTTLKQTQDGLGRFQDRAILLERLKAERALFRGGRATVDPLSFGILVGVVAGEHDHQKEKAWADCRTLRSKSFLKALDRLAAPPAVENPDGA